MAEPVVCSGCGGARGGRDLHLVVAGVPPGSTAAGRLLVYCAGCRARPDLSAPFSVSLPLSLVTEAVFAGLYPTYTRSSPSQASAIVFGEHRAKAVEGARQAMEGARRAPDRAIPEVEELDAGTSDTWGHTSGPVSLARFAEHQARLKAVRMAAALELETMSGELVATALGLHDLLGANTPVGTVLLDPMELLSQSKDDRILALERAIAALSDAAVALAGSGE